MVSANVPAPLCRPVPAADYGGDDFLGPASPRPRAGVFCDPAFSRAFPLRLRVCISPQCVDAAAFALALRRLPSRFTTGCAAHPCPLGSWAVFEYGGSAWPTACRAQRVKGCADAVGWTNFGTNCVLIRKGDDADADTAPVAVFWHEAGHFAVYPALSEEERATWGKVWSTDKRARKLVSGYAGTNAEEGLSEALRLYETRPAALAAFPAQKAFLDTLMTP